VKDNRKKNRQNDTGGEVLRRLVKAPETVNQIYELAESLFWREANLRMTLADIEQVSKYLRQTESEVEAMKKQFRDLALIEGSFHAERIPTGF
jgi:uncharacterized membrane protein